MKRHVLGWVIVLVLIPALAVLAAPNNYSRTWGNGIETRLNNLEARVAALEAKFTTTSSTTPTSTTTTVATTTTTQPTTTTTVATTTTTTSPSSGCDTAPDGAPSGSPVRGPTTYTASQTISNVVFDGNHSDDLVRVYGAHVIFDHVTFKGTGTGSSGHSVEVKRGGSVEIRNSLWNGRPVEDSIQFGGVNGDQHAGHSIVRCSTIASSPGEDHADFKVSQTGAVVDFIDNSFGPSPGRTVQNDGSVGVQNFVRNTGLADVLLENTVAGSFVANSISELYVYNSRDFLIEGNTIGRLQNGVADGRNPSGVYYRSNTIGQFVYYGGSCWSNSNSIPVAPPCTFGAPAWYPR